MSSEKQRRKSASYVFLTRFADILANDGYKTPGEQLDAIYAILSEQWIWGSARNAESADLSLRLLKQDRGWA